MSMVRKQALAPSFKPVDNIKEAKVLTDEIRKIRPVAEITLEGLNEIAKGRILDWQPERKIFTVEWTKKSEKFDEHTESHPGTRAYFKIQLFTTQLVFKSQTVRRVDEERSHFRVPEQLFHQQMRGALRVPLVAGRAQLRTSRGEFMLLDLSVGGAKIHLPPGSRIAMGIELKPVELRIGTMKVTGPEFAAKVARVSVPKKDPETGEDLPVVAGVRFTGLEERHKTQIKQFLIDALKVYYEIL